MPKEKAEFVVPQSMDLLQRYIGDIKQYSELIQNLKFLSSVSDNEAVKGAYGKLAQLAVNHLYNMLLVDDIERTREPYVDVYVRE